MSKKLFLAGAAAVSLGLSAQSAQAASITVLFDATGALPGYTSLTSVENFTGKSVGAQTGTSGNETFSGSVNVLSTNAAYSGDANVAGVLGKGVNGSTALNVGNFLSIGAVPNSVSSANPASFTIDFGSTTQQVLSFLVGTLDSFNSVSFYDSSSTLLATLTGNQIVTGPSGTTTVPTGDTIGGRATIDFNGLPGFTKVVFTSTATAFEIDEIAVAAPEPATWAMMLLGFGLVGSQLRRRARKPVQALATA